MADDTPPQWAMDKALALRERENDRDSDWDIVVTRAFARYIAEHEEPPVDPLLIEAREIAAETWRNAGSIRYADNIEAGRRDGANDVVIALAALRRGVEIGAAKS